MTGIFTVFENEHNFFYKKVVFIKVFKINIIKRFIEQAPRLKINFKTSKSVYKIQMFSERASTSTDVPRNSFKINSKFYFKIVLSEMRKWQL